MVDVMKAEGLVIPIMLGDDSFAYEFLSGCQVHHGGLS